MTSIIDYILYLIKHHLEYSDTLDPSLSLSAAINGIKHLYFSL